MSDLLSSVADMLDPPKRAGDLVWYCTRPDCDGMPHDGIEYRHARAKQHPPPGLAWFIWFILAGRGFGKTRTGAEWLVSRMRHMAGTFWGLAAPTFDDGRDLMVEGESGLLFVLDSHKIKHEWNRSLGQMTLENGARVDLFSSQKPESFRGPNLSGAWGDEPATWVYPQESWDNLMLMTRKGNPQIVLTGTPQPSAFVKDLKKKANHLTTGSTYENRDNLADVWFNEVIAPLEGTRKGRQEIYAEILEDVEGALWTLEQIDYGRLDQPKRFSRLLLAVDPSVSAKKRDECGIVVGGLFQDHGYLLGDLSLQASPEGWARVVAAANKEWAADGVVAEVNNGQDLVRSVMHGVDKSVHVIEVNASRGKTTRAEPVAALYGDHLNPETWDRARIHHVKGVNFSVLEDQQTSWVQGDRDSPDRLDALVWLMTKLMGLENKATKGRGGLRFSR